VDAEGFTRQSCAYDGTFEREGVAVRMTVPDGEPCSVGSLRISTGPAELSIEREGAVEAVWLEDLDLDGTPEAVVLTVSAGSGSYGRLHVVRLDHGGPHPLQLPSPPAEMLEGYMGHDRFEVGPGFVERSFPVYRDTDPNAEPSGGRRILRLDVSSGSWTSSGKNSSSGSEAELERLVRWMSGSFDSAEQADSEDGYFDIRLEMVPIWTDRTDARWMYVEQASAESLERPYRQRVYRVTRDSDGRLVSAVFELPEPQRFVGAFRDPDRLSEIGPDELVPRSGCAVYLSHRVDGAYRGSTRGMDCASNMRGAAYATSEVTVTESGIESWDRGFDAEGRQVWGAENGPYRFRRSTPPAPGPDR